MKKLVLVVLMWAVSSLFWVTDAVKVPNSGRVPRCEKNDEKCDEEKVVSPGRRLKVDARTKTVRGVTSTQITSRKGLQASSKYSSNTQSSSALLRQRRAKEGDLVGLGAVAVVAAAGGLIGAAVGALIGLAINNDTPAPSPSTAQPSQQPTPTPPTPLDREACMKLELPQLPEGNVTAIFELFGVNDADFGTDNKDKKKKKNNGFTDIFDAACASSDDFLPGCTSQIKIFIAGILQQLTPQERKVFCFLYQDLNTTSWFDYATYGINEFNQTYFRNDYLPNNNDYRDKQKLFIGDNGEGLNRDLSDSQTFWNTRLTLSWLKQATYFLYDDVLMLKVLKTAYGLSTPDAKSYLDCAQLLFKQYNKIGEDFPLWTLNAQYFVYKPINQGEIDGYVVLGGGLYQYYNDFFNLTNGTDFILYHEIGHYLQDVYGLSLVDISIVDLCRDPIIYDELLADALAAYFGNHPSGGKISTVRLETAAQYSVYFGNCAANVRLTEHGTGIQRRQAVEFATQLVNSTKLTAKQVADAFFRNYTNSVCNVPVEGTSLTCKDSAPPPGTVRVFSDGQELYDALHCSILPSYNSVPNWDVSRVQSFDSAFLNLHDFDVDISTWDVSSATSMRNMFAGAFAFNKPLGTWDVSKVTDMTAMFRGAASFNQPIGTWDVGRVKNFDLMFVDAEVFRENLNNWNTASATSMSKMFAMATFFDNLVGGWDVGNVQNFSRMFNEAFYFNRDISNWNVSSATDMRAMFSNAQSFNQPLQSWNVAKVTDTTLMFFAAIPFNQNLCQWGARIQNLCDLPRDFMFDITSCPVPKGQTNFCYDCFSALQCP